MPESLFRAPGPPSRMQDIQLSSPNLLLLLRFIPRFTIYVVNLRQPNSHQQTLTYSLEVHTEALDLMEPSA